ncbi:major facilitator superfamily domain-containing protein, partial [Cunninghamella echinulata]
GFLCKPAEHFPSIFGGIPFFIEYPYFLPCFVSSIGSIFGFVIGYFYLKESNPTLIAKKEKQAKVFHEQQPQEYDEATGLLSSENDQPSNDNVKKSATIPLFAFSSIGRNSIITIGAYALFAFHAMVFDEVLPLFFSTPTEFGGLGSTSQQLAKLLSVCGLWQLLSQFYVFPWLNKYYSTLELTRVSLLLFATVYFFFPELTNWKNFVDGRYGGTDHAELILNTGYFVLLLVRVFGNCLAFTGMMVMVSNSADPLMIGLVNGVLQSCLALVRALGPTVGGILWSLSLKNSHWPIDRHLVYYLIAILSFIGWIQSYQIPSSLSLGGKKRT